MNFELSEEHLAVKDAARDFAQNVLKREVIDSVFLMMRFVSWVNLDLWG